MVSIIISLFKVSNNYKICINSALNQTYKSSEIIVVANTCIETTYLTFIKKLQEEHPNLYLYIDSFTNTTECFFYGINKAKGTYTVFLNSDDYLSPVYVSTLYSLVKKYDVDLAWSSFKIFKKGKEMAGVDYQNKILKNNAKYVSNTISIVRFWNTFVRIDLIKALLEEENNLHEYRGLTTMVALLSRANSCYSCKDVLYYRGSSIMSQYAEDIPVTIDSIARCKEFNIPTKIYYTLLIDELLIRLISTILKHKTDHAATEWQEKIKTIQKFCKLQIKHPILFILGMKRPLRYKILAIKHIMDKIYK